MKNKTNLILGGIIGGWVLLLIWFIEFKSRTARFILPIFTVFAIVYLGYLTYTVIKNEKDKSNKSDKNDKN